MTDDVSISSLNSAVRFRSPDPVGATSWFAEFKRREPLYAAATKTTKHSRL
jgi:hypothetical protein